MRQTLTKEEILKKNPSIDPQELREFLEFQRLVGTLSPRQGQVSPSVRKRLVVGDPDDDDSRTVHLRYSR